MVCSVVIDSVQLRPRSGAGWAEAADTSGLQHHQPHHQHHQQSAALYGALPSQHTKVDTAEEGVHSSDQTCYSVQCAAWGQCEFGSPHQDVDLLVTESVLSVGRSRGDPGAEQPAELYMTVAGQAGHSDRKHGHQHQHHTNT